MQYYVDGATRIALAPAVPRESLTSVTLHPDTTEINQYAFRSCSNLPSIIIPERVTSIGVSAFYVCTSLATVTIDSGDIYEDVTSDTACGYLIDNATTIRVLASIIDGGSYTNTYLNGTTFTRSPTAVDGYYLFTRS